MTDRERWVERNIPTLAGRIALITGANSGLGFEAARLMAAKGARVILAVRDPARGERAAAIIREMVPGADLAVLPLDLSSLAAIRSAATAFLKWQVPEQGCG